MDTRSSEISRPNKLTEKSTGQRGGKVSHTGHPSHLTGVKSKGFGSDHKERKHHSHDLHESRKSKLHKHSNKRSALADLPSRHLYRRRQHHGGDSKGKSHDKGAKSASVEQKMEALNNKALRYNNKSICAAFILGITAILIPMVIVLIYRDQFETAEDFWKFMKGR